MIALLLLLLSLDTNRRENVHRLDPWSGCRPGSWVRYKMTSNGIDLEYQYVLLEHREGKSYTMRLDFTLNGRTTQGQPITTEIKASTPSGQKQEIQQGEEILANPKGEFRCRWIRTTFAGGWSKLWRSDRVPFQIVKLESESSGSRMTMEMVDFERK